MPTHSTREIGCKQMGDTVLGTTVNQKDIGVTISAGMKVSVQCGIAAKRLIKF